MSLEAARKITASQLLSRVNAFVYLLENGWLDRVPLSQDHSEEVIRIMDAGNARTYGGRGSFGGEVMVWWCKYWCDSHSSHNFFVQ